MIDFESDVSEREPLGADKLERVMALAELMVAQERQVAVMEQDLKDAKAALLKTQTEDLPTLMEELGMQAVKLKDGSTVEVKGDVTCGITEASRVAAHGWLVENGFGGLIKTQVVTEFGRGELDSALEYAHEANERNPENPAMIKDTVHPATLKSFVKEQLEAGRVEFPMELFNVRPFNKATYKKAK